VVDKARDSGEKRALLEKALLELDAMHSKLTAMERERGEPIAVIGTGCRLPGSVNSPDDFWRLLRDGVDAITEAPADRWDVERYYDPDPDAPGKMCTRFGGFMDRPDWFDAEFFETSPREAASLDPQQRLLLETSWEALENAGQSPERLYNSPTGVFVGIGSFDHATLLFGARGHEEIDAYFATGSSHSAAAGRLSYFLGLQGPCFAIDTACSSSLSAVHLACQSLRAGECSLALAGGVNLLLTPEININLSKARMLAPDGRCKTFDAAANGYVRSEGCGIVVLKRLSAARADRDRILAVIRGSAVNQDGPSGGLTVPNGPAQAELLRQALANARVRPEQVQYVEAHGTGTSLGDPIEVKALGAVFAEGRPGDCPLRVGSVKTNVGHLETAAGVAGLIKVVLSLQRRELPEHLHFRNPNPHIPWADLPIRVTAERGPWPQAEAPLIAGVSSFGFSGTNVHVVLEEAPPWESADAAAERPQHALTLSAKSPEALTDLARRYERFLAEDPGTEWADVCHTANCGRSHFSHRLGVRAATADDAADKLRLFADGERPGGMFHGEAEGRRPPRAGFAFPGQAGPLLRLGRDLYETQPFFRQRLDECDAATRSQTGQSLLPVLQAAGNEPSAQATSAAVQPALFAVQFAVCELWRLWGIRPDAVSGCGVGEFAAACAAGVFSLEDGLKLAAQWSLLAGERSQPDDVGSLQEQFHQRCGDMRLSAPAIPVLSPEDGQPAGEEVSDLNHWLQVLAAAGDAPSALDTAALPRMDAWLRIGADGDAWAQLLDDLLALYAKGADIDWFWFDELYARRKVALPTYPFQRRQYGSGGPASGPRPSGAGEGPAHPFLGRRLHLPFSDDVRFETEFRLDSLPHLVDHRIYHSTAHASSEVVTAGAEHVSLVLSAAYESFGHEDCVIEDMVFVKALVLPERKASKVQVWLSPREQTGVAFQTISADGAAAGVEDSDWRVHASGTVRALEGGRPRTAAARSLEEIRARCDRIISSDEFYTKASGHGYMLGETFRWIDRIWQRPGEALVAIRTPDLPPDDAGYRLHPGLLDVCFQMTAYFWMEIETDLDHDQYVLVPFRFASFAFHGLPADHGELWCHARVQDSTATDMQSLAVDLLVFDSEGRVVAEVQGVKGGRANLSELLETEAAPTADDCFYEVEWREQAPAGDAVPGWAEPGRWLILTDGGGLGAGLCGRLRDRGERCVAVECGNAYEARGADDYVVDPAAPEQFERLLKDAFGEAAPDCRGVVHLWSLAGDASASAGASLQAAQLRGCGSALHLVQALVAHGFAESPRLWLATSGAQPVADAEVDVGQAPLWGLGRAIALEHPELQCVRLDLDPGAAAEASVAALLTEVWTPGEEDQIVWRGGERCVLRLAPCKPPAPDGQPAIAADGAYLITGGLGALGLQVAEWLVERGARHLFLAGRRGPAGEAREAIRRMAEGGAQVRAVQADVTDAQDVAQLLASVRENGAPLRGIVHAAGVLDDGVLTHQDWARFAKVMGPKVAGAWNLHEALGDLAPDFFVLFSSGVSILGAPGQGSYAAANAFMDALAHHRRRRGAVALSINWGPWAEVGMAAELSRGGQSRWGEQAMGAIPPGDALGMLGRLLGTDAAQVGVFRANWSKLPPELARAPVVSELLAEAEPAGSDFLAELRVADAADQWAVLVEHVRAQLAAVLELDDSRTVKLNEGFFELGMDSLTSVELRSRLQTSLDLTLPTTLAFDYPTTGGISEFLAEQLGIGRPAPADEPAASPEGADAGMVEKVQQLSDEEIDRVTRMLLEE